LKLLTNSIGMKLALIPAGEFQMGASVSLDKEDSDTFGERPQHRVRITTPFYLGAYEVTQAEFQRVMGRNPSEFSASGRNKDRVANQDTNRFPVENVSWYDAVEFCNKLSANENRQAYYRLAKVERNEDGTIKAAAISVGNGNGYRLPTEAEWEYACRAGTPTKYNFGNNWSPQLANLGSRAQTMAIGPPNKPKPVGSFPPNVWGLFDMHGNVQEFCFDWYDKTYYTNSPVDDPPGPREGTEHVVRGGDWANGYPYGASSSRFSVDAASSFVIGFRVARSSGE
jgi:formylglycine-generating enzyme required for sulfatase activity